MRIILLISLWTLLFSLFLPAQEKKKSGPSFTAIELSKLPYEKVYYRNGKEYIEIKWRNSSRTFPYSLSKAKAFEIFIDNDDPENPYQLIGKAPLVAGTKKMLYFFAHNITQKEGSLPVKLYGIDDSEAKFPQSSYRFVNFINAPLGIDFNRKKFVIKPRQDKIQKVNFDAKGGSWVPFIVYNKKGDVLGGTRIFSHATNREMVLIFPPKKGSKRLDIRFFSD